MRARLGQREVGLACVALLATVGSLALTSSSRSHGRRLPRPAGYYAALAGVGGLPIGRETACGDAVRATTMGVAHPVLPCGQRIYLIYGGKHVLTEVIGRLPNTPGRTFDLTPALADLLGLSGVAQLHWSYAGGT